MLLGDVVVVKREGHDGCNTLDGIACRGVLGEVVGDLEGEASAGGAADCVELGGVAADGGGVFAGPVEHGEGFLELGGGFGSGGEGVVNVDDDGGGVLRDDAAEGVVATEVACHAG